MESKTVYKLGDWLEDLQTGDLYEIVQINKGNNDCWGYLSQVFDKANNCPVTYIYNTSFDFKKLQMRYKLAPAARVLYKKEV